MVARLLNQYEAYDRHDLYRDFPKFRNCFTMPAAVRFGGRAFPNWGDCNKCMNMPKYSNKTACGLALPADMALDGYRVYGGADTAARGALRQSRRPESRAA